MQIHELNTFSGTPSSSNYLAIDDGTDTGKISGESLLAPVNTRIDNLVSGVTVDSEVIDGRVGADGVTYGSLGTAIRTQVSDLKSDLSDETSARILLAGRVTTAESDIDTLETHKVAQPLDGNNQPTNGTSGQSLRTKGDGTTEWADVGLPTDGQTAQAVSSWLDEHPEATTTVQDGSLTEAKLSNALKLKTIKDYVTPEMFGAKGDGLTDDTEAIQTAVDLGKPVLMVNRYLIKSTIKIANGDTIIECTGEILFDDDIVIFDIKSSHNNIYVHKATGSHSSVADHVYSFYGTLFKLNADKVEIGYNNITVDDAENVKIAFDCYANGDSNHVYTGILYNKIAFTYIKAQYGIKFSCGSGGLPYINENQFLGGRLSGNYGVYAEKGSTQTDPYNGNKFINIGFEDIVCGISVAFFQFNSFRGVRVSESLYGAYWFVFASDCYCNSIQGDAGLSCTKINDQNSSGFPNVYEFERMLFEWEDRDRYPVVGFGGKIFKNGSGWSAEYTAAAFRDYEVDGDGEQHDVPPVGLLTGWSIRVTRNNGIAIVNIPNNSGYGYRGAEIIYFRVEAGSYSFVVRQNGSNISKASLFADQSGYYKLQYIDNREWIFYKLSDL